MFVAKIGGGTVADVISLVNTMNLPNGTANSLLAKLQNSQTPGGVTPACNKIDAFIKLVNAQTGKKITVAQASQLIGAANTAGCP